MPDYPAYGMRLRPAGPGAVPEGRYTVTEHPAFRHGAIQYDRDLTDHEVKAFELTPIGTVAEHAQRLVAKMGRYASRYAENEAALDDFVDQYHGSVGLWSTENIDELISEVKREVVQLLADA